MTTGRRLQGWQLASAVALTVAPRAASTYALYLAGPLLLVDWRHAGRQRWAALALLIGASGVAVALAGTDGTVSWTAWGLEVALLTPFLLLACGFRFVPDLRVRWFLRAISAFLLVANLGWIAVDGLPYVTTLPDAMRGLYGLGGARIVTVLGFLLIVQELRLRQAGVAVTPWLVVGAVNFLLPSYVIGIVVGLIALVVPLVRHLGRLTLLAVVSIPSLQYAWGRATRLNPVAESVTGQHPKEYAYEGALRAWTDTPSSVLLGTGPGQFSSTPQDWAAPLTPLEDRTGVVDLPGLVTSSVREEHLLSYTNQLSDYPMALASAATQPITGVGTLLAEWGPLSLLLAAAVLHAVLGGGRGNRLLVTLVAFLLGLNVVDVWIDSPWLWWGVLAVCAVSGSADSLGADPPETDTEEGTPFLHADPGRCSTLGA